MRAIYPCLCLWRLFWQTTRTTPLRRMILHFSHIGLTDGRTFMIPFGDCFPAARLWLPHGPPLPVEEKRKHAYSARFAGQEMVATLCRTAGARRRSRPRLGRVSP